MENTKTPWTAERSTDKEYRFHIMGPKGLMGKNKETRPVIAECYLVEGLGVGNTEDNAKLIVKAVNMHDELIRLLKATSEYLDRGDYPENETQYKLFNDVENAINKAQ